MKIKCPFENFETAPIYTVDELIWHLTEDHETREIVAEYYVKLLFKIHEKIESFSNSPLVNEPLCNEDFLKQNPFSMGSANKKVLQELKSLLQ